MFNKMDKNGINSCTGNYQHINIWYFFVKDREDKSEVHIEKFLIEWILAGFFIKTLQEELFRLFIEVIMGC